MRCAFKSEPKNENIGSMCFSIQPVKTFCLWFKIKIYFYCNWNMSEEEEEKGRRRWRRRSRRRRKKKKKEEEEKEEEEEQGRKEVGSQSA